jgi:hypothetical protein
VSKRQFYIKMAGLIALAGIGHRIVEVVKTSSTVVNNQYNTTCNTSADTSVPETTG